MTAMERFHIIDDAAVIIRRRGRYRQSKLYRRGDQLFAAVGSDFVRLMAANGTSDPHISWVELDAAGSPVLKDKFGAPLLAR